MGNVEEEEDVNLDAMGNPISEETEESPVQNYQIPPPLPPAEENARRYELIRKSMMKI